MTIHGFLASCVYFLSLPKESLPPLWEQFSEYHLNALRKIFFIFLFSRAVDLSYYRAVDLQKFFLISWAVDLYKKVLLLVGRGPAPS